jgi:pyruvate dehydrogenase E1 component alpha subunit
VHIADPGLGILGQSGTLGGCFPIAAGAALSAKYRRTSQVCLCFFGEGTSNRGQFHEAANAASVWRLPVVWLCENNGWAISTSSKASTAVEDLSLRAAGYAMPGIVVDGTDVAAVHDAVEEAVARAREGQGPSFIEAKVPRISPHHLGDAQQYRTKDEMADVRRRDPVAALRAKLVDAGILTEAELDEMHATLQQEVEAAAEEASAAPLPEPDRIYEGIYA